MLLQNKEDHHSIFIYNIYIYLQEFIIEGERQTLSALCICVIPQ